MKIKSLTSVSVILHLISRKQANKFTALSHLVCSFWSKTCMNLLVETVLIIHDSMLAVRGGAILRAAGCRQHFCGPISAGQIFAGQNLRANICGPKFAGQNLRANICGPIFAGQNLRAKICGPKFAGQYLRANICGPHFCGPKFAGQYLRPLF